MRPRYVPARDYHIPTRVSVMRLPCDVEVPLPRTNLTPRTPYIFSDANNPRARPRARAAACTHNRQRGNLQE